MQVATRANAKRDWVSFLLTWCEAVDCMRRQPHEHAHEEQRTENQIRRGVGNSLFVSDCKDAGAKRFTEFLMSTRMWVS